MKVVICKPHETAYIAEIESSLDKYKEIVGGWIQAIYPFEDRVALVCNDEGKLDGLPLNRTLCNEEGEVYDIIAGTFFICGLSDDDFDSLSDELAAKYLDLFYNPQLIANRDEGLFIFNMIL